MTLWGVVEIKEFKVLARKILDTHGFEHVGIRFVNVPDHGAWVVESREQLRSWTYDNGIKVPYFPREAAEYPTVTFSKLFISRCNMSQTLKIIFHELCHLEHSSNKNGVNHLKRCISKKGVSNITGRFIHEMDYDHDLLWMKRMWKYGYEGRPRFDDDLKKVQTLIEEESK